MLDLGTTFLQSAERSPKALAIVDESVRWTYAEWREEIARVAAALQRIGLSCGDRVLSLLQNRHQAATLHWACQFVGIVIVPLNWRAKPEEVDYCLVDAEAKAIFFEQASEAAVGDSDGASGVRRIGVGKLDGSIEFEPWSTWREGPLEQLQPSANADDLSLMLYTSGTTGKPKGVPRRHRHERAAALAHVTQNLYRCGERTLGVMPLYHTMGVRSLLAMSVSHGSTRNELSRS
jgi:2-furoate---CoA ligase